MSKKIENFNIGIKLSDLTKFDLGEIEDQEMISKDFKKALRITILSVLSSTIMTMMFFFA